MASVSSPRDADMPLGLAWGLHLDAPAYALARAMAPVGRRVTLRPPGAPRGDVWNRNRAPMRGAPCELATELQRRCGKAAQALRTYALAAMHEPGRPAVEPGTLCRGWHEFLSEPLRLLVPAVAAAATDARARNDAFHLADEMRRRCSLAAIGMQAYVDLGNCHWWVPREAPSAPAAPVMH